MRARTLLFAISILLCAAAARAEEQTCVGRVSIGYFVSRIGPCDFSNSSPAYTRIVEICRDGAVCEVRGEWQWTKMLGWTLTSATSVRAVEPTR